MDVDAVVLPVGGGEVVVKLGDLGRRWTGWCGGRFLQQGRRQ